jgi:LysM repeat protein
MNRIIISAAFLCAMNTVYAGKISRTEYVDTWKETAIAQMVQYKIPASITLAQAILESGSGNSALAVHGRNHFGIKCHGWTGEKMFLDDDKKGECFRVYEDARDSYQDHSDFLRSYDRYAFLFDYETDDYKSWAKGLKKAGYATNPKYPEQLITIIEELNLQELDKVMTLEKPEVLIAKNAKMSNRHKVFKHVNRVNYIEAKEGDTFYKLSKEFGVTLKQLYRYNSFDSNKDVLEAGDVVYLQPKRKGILFKKEFADVEQDMTVAELSQRHAVKVKTLLRLNDYPDSAYTVRKGERVILR